MPLSSLYSEKDRKPFIKYNAKSGHWYIGDDELKIPLRLIMDFPNLKTGWLLFSQQEPPKRVIDPTLDKSCPRPSIDFKRGFVVSVLAENIGPLEFSSSSFHTNQALVEIYNKWEAAGIVKNKVPLVIADGITAMRDRQGVNYRPVLRLEGTITRPANLPDISPVRPEEIWAPGKMIDDDIPF